MHLLKMILKATRKKGVPQRGVISPPLSNLYLNEVDRMLEKAVRVTRRGKSIKVQYARFADDMVILINAERQKRLAGDGDKQTATRGVREATRCNQRGQESDGRSEEGRELHLSRLSISAHSQLSAEMASTLCPQAETEDRAVCRAQRDSSGTSAGPSNL